MHAKLKETDASGLLYSAGLFIGVIGVFFSPFLLSMATAAMLVYILLSFKEVKLVSKKVLLLYTFPILLVLTDYLRNSDPNAVNQKLLLALGFSIMGIASIIQSKKIDSLKVLIFSMILLVVLFIDIRSVWDYLLNKDEIDQLLLQSKSIEIYGGLHHIHFGIINAICICVLSYHLLTNKKWRTFLNIAITLVLIICFHILSSRTGLVALYFSVIAVLGLYSIKEKAYMTGLIGLALVIAINIAAYNLSSSFRSKLANSVEDIESWDSPEAINYKSMGMRLEAYKVSLLMLKDKPLIGFGAAEASAQMQAYYESSHTALYKENRVGPHNQFLEYGIKYGLVGVIFLAVFFIYWLSMSFKPMNYYLLLLVLLLFISMQFESLMERQVSIFFTAILFPLIKGKDSA